ncbi:hypothetical protein BKA83DRAFT_4249990 [Pisolithus microcarpus]|nr:hypothetical protein BKA83DRAFT_4249990 [Pisolithus microcarpus]
MHVLGFPTTRSPEVPITHERLEKARVTTRVAQTFIRIGNFEALSPPSRAMFFFEWTVKRVPKLDNVNLDAGDAWGK